MAREKVSGIRCSGLRIRPEGWSGPYRGKKIVIMLSRRLEYIVASAGPLPDFRGGHRMDLQRRQGVPWRMRDRLLFAAAGKTLRQDILRATQRLERDHAGPHSPQSRKMLPRQPESPRGLLTRGAAPREGWACCPDAPRCRTSPAPPSPEGVYLISRGRSKVLSMGAKGKPA